MSEFKCRFVYHPLVYQKVKYDYKFQLTMNYTKLELDEIYSGICVFAKRCEFLNGKIREMK